MPWEETPRRGCLCAPNTNVRNRDRQSLRIAGLQLPLGCDLPSPEFETIGTTVSVKNKADNQWYVGTISR